MVESETCLAWHKPKFSIFDFRFLNHFCSFGRSDAGTDVHDCGVSALCCAVLCYGKYVFYIGILGGQENECALMIPKTAKGNVSGVVTWIVDRR